MRNIIKYQFLCLKVLLKGIYSVSRNISSFSSKKGSKSIRFFLERRKYQTMKIKLHIYNICWTGSSWRVTVQTSETTSHCCSAPALIPLRPSLQICKSSKHINKTSRTFRWLKTRGSVTVPSTSRQTGFNRPLFM